MMSICSLVVERVNIRVNGRTRPEIGRIIIGFEDQTTHQITFANKYVHYPVSDFVYNDFCFNYNGIDANTISAQGEKLSVVFDWVRAAVRSRRVIVCGMAGIAKIIGDTPCTIIDLQEYFNTSSCSGVQEPVSLARLTSKFFSLSSHSGGRRDPFQEGKFKIALYHIMNGMKTAGSSSPFREDMFPKCPRSPVTKTLLDNRSVQLDSRREGTDGNSLTREEADYQEANATPANTPTRGLSHHTCLLPYVRQNVAASEKTGKADNGSSHEKQLLRFDNEDNLNNPGQSKRRHEYQNDTDSDDESEEGIKETIGSEEKTRSVRLRRERSKGAALAPFVIIANLQAISFRCSRIGSRRVGKTAEASQRSSKPEIQRIGTRRS